MIEIIVVRHPDFDNDFHVYGGEIRYVDVDLGRSNLSDAGEFAEWANTMRIERDELVVPEARELIRRLTCEIALEHEHVVPGWASP